MSQARLAIIDDEEAMLQGLQRLLGFEMPELDCETFTSPRAAVEAIRRHPPDLVLLDVRMPDIDGMALLRLMLQEDPWLTCIMMTAHGTIELAVAAIKQGAYDFITKPFETETLVRILAKGLERAHLIRENKALKNRVAANDFHGMIGRGPVMSRLFEKIRAMARSDYSILIRGQSGTGKELAARALHAESNRGRNAFVTVNCPAIPEHLLESELFGHRRGAFTGADRDRRGLFEEASGGTVFLDEIGDISTSLQTKLLRTLQDGEIKPLGAAAAFRTDVRILAATNQNLEQKITERRFREDLFYRLNVVTLRTPNLSEARDDIPLLAAHFSRTSSHELGVPLRRFAPEALQLLARADWPGNVRQLQNIVRQAVMFSRQESIAPREVATLLAGGPPRTEARRPDAALAGGNAGPPPYKDARDRVVEQFTRQYINDLLRQTGGNVTRGAELSGLGRPSLQKIMRRMKIRSDWFKAADDD
jgi:DNA-binding NtrC family response regulator